MRLAVYAIMKNEAKHVERWLDTIVPELLPGDSVTLVDTGSTDDTVEIARSYRYGSKWVRGVGRYSTAEEVANAEWHAAELGRRADLPKPAVDTHVVTISPWRFDAARNAALALTPADADAAWSLDLDEFPRPGWRQAIEDAWHENLDRLRYKFVWSHQPDGREGVVFYADKLHARSGFHWKGIAHEWLVADREEAHAFTEALVVDHHQDHSVDRRSRDLALMERAIAELPDDERLQHYYARELFFHGRMVEASEAFQKHLANPKATWRAERAESMLYLAKTGGNEAWAHQWYYRALAEAPERREVWLDVAEFEISRNNLALGLELLSKAMLVPREAIYLTRPDTTDEALQRRAQAVRRELYAQRSREVHLGAAAGAAAAAEDAGGADGGAAALE